MCKGISLSHVSFQGSDSNIRNLILHKNEFRNIPTKYEILKNVNVIDSACEIKNNKSEDGNL